MNGIRWIKSGTKKSPHYDAKIGCINLRCRSEMNYSPYPITRWRCSVYIENKWVCGTETRESLKLTQEDGEKLAIQYLFGCGSIALKELKKMGLLEEMLSEVGVDL